MICPVCQCEYIRGVRQCSDCGVPLVDELPPPPAGIPDNVRIVPVWRGTDRVDYEKVAAALEDADIPYTKANSTSLFSSRPNEETLEIWVAETDWERANEVALSGDDSLLPEDLTPEQAAALSLPESDAPDDDDEEPTSFKDLPEYWHEDGAVAEVWSGDSEEFADTLMTCLREIGVPSHKHGDPSRWSLVVPQTQESRAREVIREVVEASPPE
jgi:hypothetical protein